MPSSYIPFKKTGYFSDLICDYLDQSHRLQPFYNKFPELNNFKLQIEEKQASFNKESREILIKVLQSQNESISVSSKTSKNISALKDSNTFTVTTGHQLNLFTGPLYFFYKIVSTINLCSELKKEYPNYNFVPIYWMASEDHDFDEINFFNHNGKKVQWSKQVSGPVGELNLSGLDAVYEAFSVEIGLGNNADTLKTVFKEAYLKHDTLAEATRYLVNTFFSELGLVILDGNDKSLKQLFIPNIKDELLNKTTFQKVSETNKNLNKLEADYKVQVNPREINLFYISDGLRERIVENEGIYQVLDTDIKWDVETIIDEVENNPERFSPNVITRPLYQEVILPNLCYIGGGGELAYWFQLKSSFEAHQVPFPILLLRNSVLLISKKQREKLEKLDIDISEMFLKQDDLITKVTRQFSQIDIDFTAQKNQLNKQFEDLYELAEKTDKSFLGAVAAQERKQVKGLEHLEKRLLKAQKRKLKEVIGRVTNIQDTLFPNQSLQERQANFSDFYLEYGDQLIQQLVLNLQPLKGEFTILNLD
ncbi:bacillithiol biosynthesis cysteine-adding enzyme BshC [Hanstruepera ponticola]|uniref:bacillithiol biosynthesis cysteine-adding enzyme BshC n=1 Tax=Hanstruepera ponticola TaxID=2042995 RepID=UPI001782D34B|nr:bacillithiol biosynthesis cysteine-adding enzyme BshC [Hanstruepera ponticola]